MSEWAARRGNDGERWDRGRRRRTWLNQKQPWPASHGSVPLLQSQPKGMYFQWPVIGNCLLARTLSALDFHGSSCESMALRDGG